MQLLQVAAAEGPIKHKEKILNNERGWALENPCRLLKLIRAKPWTTNSDNEVGPAFIRQMDWAFQRLLPIWIILQTLAKQIRVMHLDTDSRETLKQQGLQAVLALQFPVLMQWKGFDSRSVQRWQKWLMRAGEITETHHEFTGVFCWFCYCWCCLLVVFFVFLFWFGFFKISFYL